MLKSTLLSGVASVAAVSTAMASDLPVKKAAPEAPVARPAAHNWSGFSLAIGGGANFLSAKDYAYGNMYNCCGGGEEVIDYGSVGVPNSHTSDLGKFGAFGTLQIGADLQAGGMVIGAFADYNLGSTKARNQSDFHIDSGTLNNEYGNNGGTGVLTSEVKIGNSWDVGGRLGILLNDSNLVYVLGAYSNAKIDTTANYTLNEIGDGNGQLWDWTNVTTSKSSDKSGYVVGAGWETAFSEHLTLKTEFRHADYGKQESLTDNYCTGDCTYVSQSATKITNDSVRALLNYKF